MLGRSGRSSVSDGQPLVKQRFKLRMNGRRQPSIFTVLERQMVTRIELRGTRGLNDLAFSCTELNTSQCAVDQCELGRLVAYVHIVDNRALQTIKRGVKRVFIRQI